MDSSVQCRPAVVQPHMGMMEVLQDSQSGPRPRAAAHILTLQHCFGSQDTGFLVSFWLHELWTHNQLAKMAFIVIWLFVNGNNDIIDI